MAFEEEYADVLQNIEFAIVDVYRRQPNLLDYDVEEAIDALIADYKAEQQGRTPRAHRFTVRPERVYTSVKQMCEWRLGRTKMEMSPTPRFAETPEPTTPREMVDCLKRIKKSVKYWNKQGGRQGYLQFIDPFIK